MNQCDIGLIGLAVMGENLVLNMESKGFRVAVYNRTTSVTEKFGEGRGKGKNFFVARSLEEFVARIDAHVARTGGLDVEPAPEKPCVPARTYGLLFGESCSSRVDAISGSGACRRRNYGERDQPGSFRH